MKQITMALIALSTIALAPNLAEARCGSYYRSSDGRMVHVPYYTHRHMRHEMAVCRDGSHSVSHHHRGTCSRHGGVRRWG